MLSPADEEAGKSGGITLGSLNNEPVAWMLVDEINGDYMLERQPSGDYDWIPLYTHPVKELTDEEILQQALFSFGNESENFDDSYWIGFARAILRKAQGD